MDDALIPEWLAEMILSLAPWQARLLAAWIEPLADVVDYLLADDEEEPDVPAAA